MATYIFTGSFKHDGAEYHCKYLTTSLNSFINLPGTTEIHAFSYTHGTILIRKKDVNWDDVYVVKGNK